MFQFTFFVFVISASSSFFITAYVFLLICIPKRIMYVPCTVHVFNPIHSCLLRLFLFFFQVFYISLSIRSVPVYTNIIYALLTHALLTEREREKNTYVYSTCTIINESIRGESGSVDSKEKRNLLHSEMIKSFFGVCVLFQQCMQSFSWILFMSNWGCVFAKLFWNFQWASKINHEWYLQRSHIAHQRRAKWLDCFFDNAFFPLGKWR